MSGRTHASRLHMQGTLRTLTSLAASTDVDQDATTTRTSSKEPSPPRKRPITFKARTFPRIFNRRDGLVNGLARGVRQDPKTANAGILVATSQRDSKIRGGIFAALSD